MKKSKRLKVVLDLAERNEQEALERLTNARRYLDDQKGQVDSLKSYHAQYLEDLKLGIGSVQNAANLQSNLHFMGQIDLAIQQQEQTVSQAQKAFDVSLKAWTEVHQKKKGLQDLIARYGDEEQIIQDKQEQKQLEDALQARSYRRK